MLIVLIEEKKLKYIEEILDENPIFDIKFLNFLQWASDYYMHPIGQVVFVRIREDQNNHIPSIRGL